MRMELSGTTQELKDPWSQISCKAWNCSLRSNIFSLRSKSWDCKRLHPHDKVCDICHGRYIFLSQALNINTCLCILPNLQIHRTRLSHLSLVILYDLKEYGNSLKFEPSLFAGFRECSFCMIQGVWQQLEVLSTALFAGFNNCIS